MAYIDNVTNILQIQPDGLPTFVRLSQNENGRNLYFQLVGNEIDIPANSTVVIEGTKPDGTVYSGTGSISDNVILIPEMIQMTAAAGYWDAKVKITSGGNTIATGRIRFVIDADTVEPGSVPSDSVLEGLVAQAQQYAETARTEAYGSPLTATTAAGMTDKTRVYVYTGSQSGYTAGHWYFWNGSAWTDGGIYNSVAVNTDPTLKLSGVAADAKATGDAIAAVTIETDKTLSVSDAPADAKVVGDEITSLKADLGAYNSVNYLVDSGSTTDHGVTFTWDDGVCTFSGTSTSTALYNFVYSQYEWVDWLIRGETYTVKYSTTDSNVRLRFSFYVNEALDSSVYIDNDSTITIPSNATGIIIRLNISSGKTVSGSCTAAMFYAMSNKELSDLCTASVGKYVAFGDSLIWGAVWDDDPSTTYYQAAEKYRMPHRIAMATGHYGKYDNQGISGASYVYKNGVLTSTILNYNYSGVDLITIFGGANDKLHTPLGTAESTTSDGTVCGAILEIITYLKTAAPKAKVVILQPCPSGEESMDNIWNGKCGGGWSLNDFDREVSKLCADNHVGYCNWNQSTYCNNWKQHSGGYSAGVEQNYSHPKSESDYALLGDFIAGKINAVSQTYDTLVNDEIDYLKDDINYGIVTPNIDNISAGLTRKTVDGKLRLYGGLDSSYTSVRNLVFLNGQNQIGTSSTVFTKTLTAGTYRISFKISGVYTAEQRLRLTYSTYADSWYVYNNDIVTLDNDAVVAYRIINGVTYGNSDGSTYTEIDVSITKLTAKDDYVRDIIGNSRIVTQKMPHIISFVDDDASKTEYVTKYHDACMHNGITGNYAVLTVYLGNDYTDKNAMLGWEDEGFGMLIHAYRQNSTDHNYWILSNRDIDKCRANLAQGLRDMQNYGFCNYKYWITPSGVHDDEIVGLARFFGMKCLISSGQGVYNNPAESDRYFVKRASLSPAESADTRTNMAYVKSLIDAFVNDAKGGWLIITTHFNEWTGNTWDATLDANGYPIGYARFNELAQYAIASGADIMSIPAGFSYLEPHLVN